MKTDGQQALAVSKREGLVKETQRDSQPLAVSKLQFIEKGAKITNLK